MDHDHLKKPIRLEAGGATWTGWTLSPWGRAREWRLIDPAGTTYTPDEVRSIHALAGDADWLRIQVRERDREIELAGLHFNEEEIGVLLLAAEAIRRVLAAARGDECRPTSPAAVRDPAESVPGSLAGGRRARRPAQPVDDQDREHAGGGHGRDLPQERRHAPLGHQSTPSAARHLAVTTP